MKNKHRKYSRISLEYFQVCRVVPEEWQEVCTLFNEEYRLFENDCGLQLRLKLDDKTIWSYCNIDTLCKMAYSSGKFYPFTCDDCAIEGCAGIFAPCRIIHHHNDIILCLRRPLQESKSRKWHYRAFRLHKKEFFKELLAAVNFRISMEKLLNINVDCELNDEKRLASIDLLVKVFGFADCQDYQYEISRRLRKVLPELENYFFNSPKNFS